MPEILDPLRKELKYEPLDGRGDQTRPLILKGASNVHDTSWPFLK